MAFDRFRMLWVTLLLALAAGIPGTAQACGRLSGVYEILNVEHRGDRLYVIGIFGRAVVFVQADPGHWKSIGIMKAYADEIELLEGGSLQYYLTEEGPGRLRYRMDDANRGVDTTRTLSRTGALAGCSGGAAELTVPRPPVTPTQSQLSDETRLAATNAFRAEFKALREKYPAVGGWSEAENNQYRIFMGTRALEILDRHKVGMEKSVYDTIAKPAIEMRDQGRAACPACKVEYPATIRVPGLDTPSASFEPQYKAAQNLYASNQELERAQQRGAYNANNPSGSLFGALANAGKPSLIHNRANDATACIRVEPTGAQMEWGIEGRYRLRNNCSYPISASWCANSAECGAGRGNLWTIGSGKDWPIYFADLTNPNIQVGACKAGTAREPPLGQQNVERTGFNAARDQPAPAPGISLLPNHRCE